jgi:hypothetical protein
MTNYHITCSFVNDFNRQENLSATSLSDSDTKIFNPHSTNGSGGFLKETTNALQ